MLLKWGCGQALFFGFNWLELSQHFANACISSQFHSEIHLKAKSVSVRFKSVALSWVLYQQVMPSVGLVGGNCFTTAPLQSSDSHRSSHRCLLIVTLSRRVNAQCPSNAEATFCKTLLRGILSMDPSEVDAYYWSISYFKKTPCLFTPLSTARISCSRQDQRSPDTACHWWSFILWQEVLFITLTNQIIALLLHSCSSSILRVPCCQDHTAPSQTHFSVPDVVCLWLLSIING